MALKPGSMLDLVAPAQRRTDAADHRRFCEERGFPVPPWQTPEERAAVDDFVVARPRGMTIEHIAPLRHPEVIGMHVRANLEYLTSDENYAKGNRLPEGLTPAEAVRRGLAVWRRDMDADGTMGALLMHLTSAAALAAARQLVAQHPDALLPAQVIRLPGLEASYAPAVRLRVGAVAPEGIEGVSVLEAEPEPPEPKVVKVARAPKPPKPPLVRVHRVGQAEKALELLRRPEGVSAQELCAALEVQPHTGRALLSRFRRTMTIERGEDGRYSLPVKPSR